MKRKWLVTVAILVSLPYPASASLIFNNSLGGVSGAGLGGVASVLVIQSPGSTSNESGSVLPPAFEAFIRVSNIGVLAAGGTVSFGNINPFASQWQFLRSVGITRAEQLAIVLNAFEPDDSVTITGLQLDIYRSDPSQAGEEAWKSVFHASIASAMNFPPAVDSLGNRNLVFTLDTADVNALNGVLSGLTPFEVGLLILGLSASASNATGGAETFSLARVPEPGTLLLLGTVLATGAGWRYTRRLLTRMR